MQARRCNVTPSFYLIGSQSCFKAHDGISFDSHQYAAIVPHSNGDKNFRQYCKSHQEMIRVERLGKSRHGGCKKVLWKEYSPK